MTQNDVILLRFSLQEYNLEEMKQIMNNVQAIFPKNKILCLPKNISFSIFKEINEKDGEPF